MEKRGSAGAYGLIVLGAVMCLPFAVLADERPAASVEEMFVTGSRTPKSLVDSSVSVAVMEGEVLRQVSQTTVAQALDFMPGVVVKRSVKDGYNVYMQGFDGDRVLVLLDGQPLVSPAGAAVDLDQVSVVDIERIEILRGAGSVLYGSSAMGGVINIITRKQDRTRLSLNAELADYGADTRDDTALVQQYRVSGAVVNDKWFGNLHLQTIEDPGFDYDAETVQQDAASLEKKFARVGLGRYFDSLKAEYRVHQFSELKRKDRVPIAGQNEIIYYSSDVEQLQHDIRLQETSDEASLWQVNVRYTEHEEISGDSNGLRYTDINLAALDAQNVWMLSGKELVAGVVLHEDTLNQRKLGNAASEFCPKEVNGASRNSFESFMQMSWIEPKNEFSAGARVQNDSDFGWHGAARASGLKTFEISEAQQLQWRIGAGQSYRVPTLKERFYCFDHSNIGYMVMGNDSLQPEVAFSFNNTLTWANHFDNYSKNVSVELNIHFSEAEHLIDTLLDTELSAAEAFTIYRYANIDDARLQGVDISTEYQQNQVRLQVNYSYLDARNGEGFRLEGRPYHQFKANLHYSFDKWNLTSLLYVVHERDEMIPEELAGTEQNQWASWNFNISQPVGKHLTWRAGIDNLFNEHKNPAADSQKMFDLRPVSSRKVFLSISLELL